MALVEIRNYSFTYAGETETLLDNITLSIEEGEITLFCGPTGCGKTTLLKQMKKEIAPIGRRTGDIFYNHIEISEVPANRAAKEIGIVFQDPENQIVTSTVWHELAFSLENFGYSSNQIRKKVAEMASFFGFEDWMEMSIHELSGGQKQLVNLASILLLQPRLLLLDEPTAQLDPIAAREFLQMINRVNKEFNTTIVIVEHHLEEVFSIADQVVMLENGRVVLQGSPQEIIASIDKTNGYFQYMPEITKLFLVMNDGKDWESSVQAPVTVRDGQQWLACQKEKLLSIEQQECKKEQTQFETVLECKEVFFQYNREEKLVLNGASYSMPKGAFSAIIGGNGAGKSTLLKVLAGLETPRRGKVLLQGKPLQKRKLEDRYRQIGYLSQNPLALFTEDSVREELNVAANLLDSNGPFSSLHDCIDFFQLQKVLDKHPYDLSGGERQKLAIAIILLKNPELLLIDEPTKGLDPQFKLEIGELLKQLQMNGISILMVTHDIEFAAKYADYCSLLFAGAIVAKGTVKEMFSENYFYTTTINRLVREVLPQALHYEDVLQAWRVAK